MRHDLLELGKNRGSIAERHGDVELVEAALQRRPRELDTFGAGDLGTSARENSFVGVKEFLEKLFSRTEADELEFLTGFTGEVGQGSCQVRDPNRFPMSSTRMSPFRPIAKACNTRLTASETVIKKRVISGWVMVMA